MKEPVAKRFCKCIKKVKKTVKRLPGRSAESSAIAVCVKSVIQSRGKTLRKFKCGRKPRLQTQPLK